MKHSQIDKRNLGSHQWLITIELIPETESDKIAIKNVQEYDASHEQKELIDNYLIFAIGSRYSLISGDIEGNNIFSIRALLN